MAQAKRDENYVPTLLGVSSTDNSTPVKLLIDPVTGRLLVDVSGSGSGGTAMTDDAAFTAGTTQGTPIFGFFNDTLLDSVHEGDGGAVRMSANRILYMQIRDAAGNERGANVNASGQLSVFGPVTNAGTFVVQENGAALTSLQLIDDAIKTDDAAFTPATDKLIMVGFEYDDTGTDSVDEGDAGAARMSANRNVYIQIRDGQGNERSAYVTAANALKVDGSAVTQPVSMATNTPVGTVAHDAADSGAPIKIGFKAESSPKGITPVADGDRADGYSDLDGLQMVKLNTSNADIISERVSNTDGNSTAFSNFSAVASTYNYVTGYSIFRTDAGTSPIYVDFRDGTAGSILWSVVIPPNSGANLAAAMPLFKTSANTALAYDVSAATTTVYISVTGFQSKV